MIVLQLIQTETEERSDLTPTLPERPPGSYAQNDLRTYDEAQRAATPVPYIAAEFDYSLFPKNSYFTIGNSNQPNDNSAFRNGPVAMGGFYTVFLRAFTDTRGSRVSHAYLYQYCLHIMEFSLSYSENVLLYL